MQKTLLNPILTLAALFLTGTLVHAQSVKVDDGTLLRIQTAQVGKHIVGIDGDGRFFAIVCESNISIWSGWSAVWSADLLFPNSEGDIVLEHYKTGAISMSTIVRERSPYISLSSAAATQVCQNPNGHYGLRMSGADSKKQIQIASYLPVASGADQPELGQTTLVHTGQVGKKIIAVTGDGRFFAIICNAGTILSSTADFIYPNAYGKLVVENYNAGYQVSAAPSERAAYLPLSATAVEKICNYPNGMYTLQVTGSAQEAKIDYVSGQSFEAGSRRGGRGF